MASYTSPLGSQQKYQHSAILVVSIILLVLGCLIVGLTIAISPHDFKLAAAISLYSVYWAGLPTIITAVIGIIAGVKKQQGQVIAFMVLSIITSVVAGVMAVVLPVVLVIICGLSGSCFSPTPRLNLVLYITLAVDAVLIFIGCLVGSILSCKVTCLCCRWCNTGVGNKEEPEVIVLTPSQDH